MLKVLVTGANGFLGYYLAEQLLSKKYFVIATGKGTCRLPFQSQNFVYETMDFANANEVKQIFKKHQPAVIIHSGAMSKPDECELNKEAAFLTNVTGTLHLLNEAALLKSFFIFLSTDFIFSGEKGMYKEEEEAQPVNYYGQTKLLAENEVKKYSGSWSIVRTVLVYGRSFSNRQNILTGVADALQKGEKPKIFNDQLRTPTYVEDLAGSIIKIVEKKAKGIYHISGEDVKSPYEMCVDVASYLKLDASLITVVTEKDFQQPARRPLKTGFNISKAKRELNFQPVSFAEGLEKTFRKN